MKYMDYAAFGAASSAYGAAASAYEEAIRARLAVAALWDEHQRLRDDIDSQRYDRGFQKWVEELIYQFSKIVKAISDSPGNPINDCADIASFLLIINENKLNTALVSGLENKEKFDEILLTAKNLLYKLESTPQVQDYIRQQEAIRLQQEAILLEQERLHRAEEARLMAEYEITFDGKQYVYKEYRYDKLYYAVDYAKNERSRT
jgi:hypothetical protein